MPALADIAMIRKK